MRFLGIDSSTSLLDCAIVENGKILANGSSDNEKTHSQRAMVLIDSLFLETGLRPLDMDFFVCSNGPGSYTGVRIGAAIAKGLAATSPEKARGVNILKLMARTRLAKNSDDKLIIPYIPARNGAVFAQGFDSELNVIFEMQRLDFEELQAKYSNAKFVQMQENKWGFAKLEDFLPIEIAYLGNAPAKSIKSNG